MRTSNKFNQHWVQLVSPKSSFSPALYTWLAPESCSSDESQGAEDGSETLLELELTGVVGDPCKYIISEPQPDIQVKHLVPFRHWRKKVKGGKSW